MSVLLKAAGISNSSSGAGGPEGVSFDGTNDYLSRSSDLSGNADGKTFTFSVFGYLSANGTFLDLGAFGQGLYIYASGTYLFCAGYDSAGTKILDFNTPTGALTKDTFLNIEISIDLANTANRSVYINDKLVTPTWSTYSNSTLNFTNTSMKIGDNANSNGKLKGRLAHVFLDYTYRDLSIESNRRLFIDSDGKPSSTIPSSPILYLPMTDAATAGSNSGTGGDFTVNGVLDTAGRGPNQDNCSASEFLSGDYLSRSSVTGAGSFTQMTVSAIWYASNSRGFTFGNTTGSYNKPIAFSKSHFNIENTTGGNKVTINTGLTEGEHHVTISIRPYAYQVFIDGVDANITASNFSGSGTFVSMSGLIAKLGRVDIGGNIYYELGSIGEFYLDDSYIDLATDNPFWDSDLGKPNSVRKVIADTGVTPLIALPLRGEDAGNNLGSGGDFTVNSGPYTGARGGSEFWSRSIGWSGSGTAPYLSNGTIPTSDGTQATLVFAFKSSGSRTYPISLGGASGTSGFDTSSSSTTDSSYIKLINSSNSIIVKGVYPSIDSTAGNWHVCLFSVDTTSTSKRHFYIDQSSVSVNWQTWQASQNIRHGGDAWIGSDAGSGGSLYDSPSSFLYYSSSYINFSQESNRHLFLDQLGYPKDLTPAIEAGTIADPLIYMKYEDTSAFGTNSGTGGNFTVNGTVTAGADVDPNA